MIKIRSEKIIKIFQNIAIILIIISGIAHITLTLPHIPGLLGRLETYYGRISDNDFLIHRTLSIVVGFILLFLSYQLSKRIRFAWVITIITLFVSSMLYTVHFHRIANPMTIIEICIITILTLSYNDFCRKSDKVSVRFAFMLAGVSVFLVLLNTSLTFFILKHNYANIITFSDSLTRSIELLFFMDTSVALATTRVGILFAKSAIILNWICLSTSLILIMKPLIYNIIVGEHDKNKVRHFINLYGQNPISYLALENDKKYFFSKTYDGVAAYTTIGDVVVCCGDLICPPENVVFFLSEFMSFCKQNGRSIAMLNVTDRFLSQYKSAGFGCVKYGEDAYFKLSEYNLSGGEVASVRAAINHANKLGITVCEYNPNLVRNTCVEHEINNISVQWMKSKKCTELSFMFGSLGFDNPQDRRYFVARSVTGQMLGFIMFIPFDSGHGYLAEMTRRLPDAPQGVLEKITYEAFMIMKSEGVPYASLGLVPLVNVRENDKTNITVRLFEFIYENLNNIYGFKALYHAKKKYAPTMWQARYLVYYPATFNAKIAYSIVKAQNPKGVSNYILTILKRQTRTNGKDSE